jgi:hypothetical protein
MRRLHILQIFSGYIHFDGEESSVFRIGDALQQNHDVEYYIGSTKEFLGTDLLSKIRAPFHAYYNLPIAQRLRKYQEIGNFDLLQIHNVLPALCGPGTGAQALPPASRRGRTSVHLSPTLRPRIPPARSFPIYPRTHPVCPQ